MPLPLSRNIEIRNAVRKGLYRPQIIEFIDEADIARLPASRLKALVAQGSITAARVEQAVPVSMVGAPSDITHAAAAAKRKPSPPVEAGDYVSGLTQSLNIIIDLSNTYASTGTLSITGPCVITDITFNHFTPGAAAAVSYDSACYADLRLSDTPHNDRVWGSYQEFLNATFPIFQTSIASNFPLYLGAVHLNAPRGEGQLHIHTDCYIDSDFFYPVLYGCPSPGGLANRRLNCFIQTREVGAAERLRYRPQVKTVTEYISRPPASRAAVVRESRVSGAPKLTVTKSAEPRVAKYYSVARAGERYGLITDEQIPRLKGSIIWLKPQSEVAIDVVPIRPEDLS